MSSYYDQAGQQINASHNKKVQAMQNQLASQQLALENQKGGINQSYDAQVGNQNLNNKKAKNNMSNSMLGRGFGNSSIATSGLAEADQVNNRMVNQINTARTGDLNGIEAQKQQLATSLQGTIGTMEADKEDAIWSLARQLEDRQWQKDFENTKFAYQKQQGEAENAFRQQQLAMQQENNQYDRDFKERQFSASQQKENQKWIEKQDPRTVLLDMRSIAGDENTSPQQKISDLQYYKSMVQGVSGMEYIGSEIDRTIASLGGGSRLLTPQQKQLGNSVPNQRPWWE